VRTIEQKKKNSVLPISQIGQPSLAGNRVEKEAYIIIPSSAEEEELLKSLDKINKKLCILFDFLLKVSAN